ncbi:MAG: hypothetical protein V4754_18820, partial [Pseudomonadota bacterium]
MTTTTITASQLAALDALLKNNDRVAFYLKLNEYTGSKTALMMAQISSSSGFVGGAAWAINNAYDVAIPGYPVEGVEHFSTNIALGDFRNIQLKPVNGGYQVPDDKAMLEGAYSVWKGNGLGIYFPGNSMIAANYLADGDVVKATEFFSYATVTAPIIGGLGFGDIYWEAFDSPLNAGKSIQEFLSTHPGARVTQSANGMVQAVTDASGKTVGAFVNNPLDAIPLTTLQALRALVSDTSIRLATAWNAFISERSGKISSSGNYDAMGNFIADLQDDFYTAEVTRSPLILDLNGNGIDTIIKTADIHFDHDGNHFAETTGWVGKDDGLLVWDRNGNGQIDDGSELFGNNTNLAAGGKAANGFAALAEVDSNRDGKIDANDALFNRLRVWKDGDSNAVVSSGELLTLTEVGVRSIGTGFVTQSVTDAQGNQHSQAGQYTRTDGTKRAIEDVWFAADTARTVDQDMVAVNVSIASLPELQGFGNVHSLHQAMARDASGRLKSLVTSFVNESNVDTRSAIMTTLMYAWAGVEGIDPASRAATQIYGNAIGDARKLATLEAFLGEGYLGTWCWGTRLYAVFSGNGRPARYVVDR